VQAISTCVPQPWLVSVTVASSDDGATGVIDIADTDARGGSEAGTTGPGLSAT
jgi:hypothetical protein